MHSATQVRPYRVLLVRLHDLAVGWSSCMFSHTEVHCHVSRGIILPAQKSMCTRGEGRYGSIDLVTALCSLSAEQISSALTATSAASVGSSGGYIPTRDYYHLH